MREEGNSPERRAQAGPAGWSSGRLALLEHGLGCCRSLTKSVGRTGCGSEARSCTTSS